MTGESLSFFTLDHGTATTAAALIAPSAGRFRILAAASVPHGVDPEALLGDLCWRVVAADAGLLPRPETWRDWARLEAGTNRPGRLCLVTSSPRGTRDLEAAFGGAGWEVADRFSGPRLDPLALGEACLDPTVDAVAVGAAEGDDRAALDRIWRMVAALASMRDDLLVLACGSAPARPEGLRVERLLELPAAVPAASTADSALRDGARDLAATLGAGSRGPAWPDARQGLRASVTALAGLLEKRVEGVEVGAGAGSRTQAGPGGEIGHAVLECGALVPAAAMRDDLEAEAILRWSTLRSDSAGLVDRLRNLRLTPWRELAGDGARLRLAAVRAALGRMDAVWRTASPEAPARAAGTDLFIVCGGGFAALPPPAAVLAVADALRLPGATALFHDHARVLGPLGTLPDDADRRRLLVDLLDDALLPLGSAIITGEVRGQGRQAATLRVSSELSEQEIQLAPGALRLVDLPPGISARLDLETREGGLMGVRARRLSLEVSGGLGGLLVDTREVPLRLPDRPDRRRGLLETWERPVWAEAEA